MFAVKVTEPSPQKARSSAADETRYLEIRGDTGVGKSALLKELAAQASADGAVIVLRPGRTPKRGGAASRASIGFAGTLREMLMDLASDGGAHLFVDNVDDFDDEEQSTIADLIRDASTILGFVVVVTGRRSADMATDDWLPVKALPRSCNTSQILIEDLTPEEVDELRALAPHLALLLADTYAARDVARISFDSPAWPGLIRPLRSYEPKLIGPSNGG